MLSLAVFAPNGMSLVAKANKPKPIAIIIKPRPYLTEAGGLYLLSHHLVNRGAKMIMNKEFKMANQVIGTSVSVA